MMIALIEDNREAIIALCERYGVQSLAVFGSAANGTFDPATSDIDFAIEFLDYGPGIAKRFMRLLVALEDLLGKDVDVVTPSSVKKQWLLEELSRTAVTVYESRDRTEAA